MISRAIALFTVCGLAAAVLGGCATAPSLALERARTAVGVAHADPAVARHAPAELVRAAEALAHANGIWRQTHDEAQTNHLAYVAALRAEAAISVARSRMLAAGIRPAATGVDHASLRAGGPEAAAPR